MAVPPLRQAVHGLPALSPCRGSGSFKPPVLEKAGEYLGTENSYRKTVKDQGMPIMYDNRKPAKGWQPVGLAPSTVWRWLSWLGGMPGTLRGAWELIRQKEPDSTLHRQTMGRVAAKVSLRAAAGHADRSHAGAGAGSGVWRAVRGGNLPPLRNEPGVFVR